MSTKQRGRIEARSIDWVPPDERHGNARLQGALWFLGNMVFFTMAVGFIGPSLGLSLGWAILAGVSGAFFGTVFMAFHATQGPIMGLPQMIQSRAQLGYRGVSVALLAAILTYVAQVVAFIVVLSLGLHDVFGWDPTIIAIATSATGAGIAIFGHDLVHRFFQILLAVAMPFYVALTAAILFGGIPTSSTGPHGGFVLSAFVAQFTAAAAWNLAYAPLVSDYSRYLPKSTPARAVTVSVFLGAALSASWLIAIGCWMAVSFGASDALLGLYAAGNEVFDGMGAILAVLSALALVGGVGMASYSAHLTVLTAADSVRAIRPTRYARVCVILVFSLGTLIAGLAMPSDSLSVVFTALTIMLCVLVPWTSFNLVDYFFVRRGHYRIADIFTPAGIYGTWNWRGLTAYGFGFLAQIPFLVLPDIYSGPVAKSLDNVDISFLVGLIVAGSTYYLLHVSGDYDIGQLVEPDPATAQPLAEPGDMSPAAW